MDVDGARSAVVVVAPHLVEQHLARKRLARIEREEPQQLVLLVGEVDDFPAQPHGVAILVDCELGTPQHAGLDRLAHRAEDALHAQAQLVRVEGRHDQVAHGHAGAHEVELHRRHDREQGGVALELRVAHERGKAAHGQPDVEVDTEDARWILAHGEQAALEGGLAAQFVRAVAERRLGGVRERARVTDHQYLRHRFSVGNQTRDMRGVARGGWFRRLSRLPQALLQSVAHPP